MADVTSIYGNPIKDAVARADISTLQTDVQDVKDGLSDLETQITATLITDTASGAIASFPDGADGVPVKSLTVDIEPVQDLHGQANPYPAGGGKNIVNISTISAPSTSNTVYELPTATESGNYVLSFQITNVQRSYTSVSSVVRVFYGDGTDYYFDTAEIKRISDDQTMQAGTYPLTGRYYLKVANKAITKITFLWRSDTFMNLTSGSVSDIMLESGTSATTYAPYSNICPISGHTSAVVTRTGINFIDVDDVEIGIAWNGNTNSARARLLVPVIPNTTYTISMNGTNDLEGVYSSLWSDISSPVSVGTLVLPTTFDTGSNKNILCLQFNKTAITKADIEALKLQLELGSASSAYEPYAGQTYTIDLDGTRYGGSLDVGTGVLTVDRILGVFNGSEAWSEYTSHEGYTYRPTNMKTGIRQDGVSNMLNDSKDSTTGQKNAMWLGVNSNILFVIGVYESMGSTLADFKSYLSQHNLEVVYPIATPITVQLTAQEVTTLKGTNNIWADCGNVEVEYRADTKLYIQKVLNA